MMRDHHRGQVYSAEDLAGEATALSEPRAIDFLSDATDALCGSRWWQVVLGCGPVSVALNRSEQRSYYSPDTRMISLSPRACDLGTLTHELAHAAAFDRDEHEPLHGLGFRTLHVQVRAALLGTQCADDLLTVYRQFGLSTDPADHAVPTAPVLAADLYLRARIVGRPAGGPCQATGGPIAL